MNERLRDANIPDRNSEPEYFSVWCYSSYLIR